jgi:hypothetical protein
VQDFVVEGAAVNYLILIKRVAALQDRNLKTDRVGRSLALNCDDAVCCIAKPRWQHFILGIGFVVARNATIQVTDVVMVKVAKEKGLVVSNSSLRVAPGFPDNEGPDSWNQECYVGEMHRNGRCIGST